MRAIPRNQSDCPRCGTRLDSHGLDHRDSLLRSHCPHCLTYYVEASPALRREPRRSRWEPFIRALKSHARAVSAGEAGPDRLVAWLDRATDNWDLPLTPAAREAILAAATATITEETTDGETSDGRD